MHGKEKKKKKTERGEKEEEKIGDQRNKKEKKSVRIFSSVQSSFFGSIRNTLFTIKHTISTFVFMQDFFDEQIM